LALCLDKSREGVDQSRRELEVAIDQPDYSQNNSDERL